MHSRKCGLIVKLLKAFVRGMFLMVNGLCAQLSPNMGVGYLLVSVAVLHYVNSCWLCVYGYSTIQKDYLYPVIHVAYVP